MSKYGYTVYGTSEYGETETDNLLWAIQIDWNDDDLFGSRNEANRVIGFSSIRGKDHYINADGIGFEPNQIGQLILTLDNYDGVYDPRNTDSELYPYVEPGHKVNIFVRDGVGGTDYYVFTGVLQDIIPTGNNETVDFLIEDGNRWLYDRETNTTTLSTSVTGCMTYVLDSVNWPSIWGSSLDTTGSDSVNPFWGEGRAKNSLEELANSFLGFFFIASDGKATYYSRNVADSSVVEINDSETLKDIEIPQPWEFKRNIITIKSNARSQVTSQTVWSFPEIIEIGNGESTTITAEYTYNGQVVGVEGVSFSKSANAAEDGSGADLTADFDLSYSDSYATKTNVTITNNSGSNGYLRSLVATGDPFYIPYQTYAVEKGADYTTRPKSLYLDLKWQGSYYTAQSFAEFLVEFLGDPRLFPTIYIEGRPEIQFLIDLYDIVTLNIESMNINYEFRVLKIKHTALTSNLQSFRTEIKLMPTYGEAGVSQWILGTSLLGTDTYLGW